MNEHYVHRTNDASASQISHADRFYPSDQRYKVRRSSLSISLSLSFSHPYFYILHFTELFGIRLHKCGNACQSNLDHTPYSGGARKPFPSGGASSSTSSTGLLLPTLHVVSYLRLLRIWSRLLLRYSRVMTIYGCWSSILRALVIMQYYSPVTFNSCVAANVRRLIKNNSKPILTALYIKYKRIYLSMIYIYQTTELMKIETQIF